MCAAIDSVVRSLTGLVGVVGSLAGRGGGLILKAFYYILALIDLAVTNLDAALTWIIDSTLPHLKAAWTWIIDSTLPYLKATWTWITISTEALSSKSIKHLRNAIDITQVWFDTYTKTTVRVVDGTLIYKILAAVAIGVIAIGMLFTAASAFRAYWRLGNVFGIRLRGWVRGKGRG